MRTFLVLLTVAVAGCAGPEQSTRREPQSPGRAGGGLPPSPEPSAAEPAASGPGGGPATEASASAEAGAGAQQPRATGPGRLTVGILVGREEVDGPVRVLSASGRDVVEEARAGQTITVPAGQYLLEAEIGDESILADTPTERTRVFRIEPGEERTEKVEFGLSRVKLKVLRGNRRIRNATIKLRRQGGEKVVVEMKAGGDFVPVSPGRYDGTVRFGRTKVEVNGIVFQGGAEQQIPIRVQ